MPSSALGTLRLNQDCVDIVVECAAVDLDALLELRAVARCFWTAVQNLVLLLHRRSGVAAGVLTPESLTPLRQAADASESATAGRLARVMLVAEAEHITRLDRMSLLSAGSPDANWPRIHSVALDVLARRSSLLERVDVAPASPGADFERVVKNSLKLRHVSFEASALSEVSLGSLAVLFGLRALVHIDTGVISNGVLCSIARHGGAGLESLTIGFDAKRPLDLDLGYVAEHCPQLTRFGLRHAASAPPNAGGRNVKSFERELLALVAKCDKLQTLTCDAPRDSLCDPRGNGGCANAALGDEALAAIAVARPELRSVTLRCTAVTDEGLQAVAKHCRQLTTLDVAGNSRVSDRGLFAVAGKCSALTSLDFSDTAITPAGVMALALFAPQLTSVKLRGCAVCPAHVVDTFVKRCPHLRTLDVAATDITDEGLDAVLEVCLDLQDLSVTGCQRLSAESVRTLEERCPSNCRVRCDHAPVNPVGAPAATAGGATARPFTQAFGNAPAPASAGSFKSAFGGGGPSSQATYGWAPCGGSKMGARFGGSAPAPPAPGGFKSAFGGAK